MEDQIKRLEGERMSLVGEVAQPVRRRLTAVKKRDSLILHGLAVGETMAGIHEE